MKMKFPAIFTKFTPTLTILRVVHSCGIAYELGHPFLYFFEGTMTGITAEEELRSALNDNGEALISQQDNLADQRDQPTPRKSRKAKPPAPQLDEQTNTVWI